MDTSVPADLELLQQARQFDPQALAAIYDAYSPGLYRYAMRRLGDQQLAEDCVGETFSRLLKALQNGRGPADHLQAYLYRVAHNWIVDQYRREPPPAEELDEEMVEKQDGPEEQAASHQRQERLRAVLKQLTPDQQQVIALKYLEGWENESIARALRKPVGAVKALQHRALAALKKKLDGEDLL